MLAELTTHDNSTIQLNALWALMVCMSRLVVTVEFVFALYVCFIACAHCSLQSASYQADAESREKLKLCFGYSRLFKYVKSYST